MTYSDTHEGAPPQPLRVLPGGDFSRRPRCPTARELVAQRVRPDVAAESPRSRVPGGPDLDAFRSWTPEAQERALQLLQQREANTWRPFYCPVLNCDGLPHDNWTWNHGRGDQKPPPLSDDWLVWLLMGGRGAGKTRSGSEAVHRLVRKVGRVHLIAPTGPDLRDTMVEGVSGLQVTAPPDFVPQWEPSKKRLTWPNGAIAVGFSGEEPDRLRGPQCYATWIDEPAHMPLIEDVWDNMLFGLRLGKEIGWSPRVIATTTPVPTKWMKRIAKDETTRISNPSTYANLANLADTYRKTVVGRYEGTRTGQQELMGRILESVEGALWNQEMIHYGDLPDHFDRIVVGIDPAGTKNKTSDETGIVVVGIVGETLWVLEDRSAKYSPSGWATAAVRAYHKWSADALVPEKNYGGDMVREVLEKNGAHNIRIKDVTSRRGKAIRAEPIVARYEKKDLVMHLPGKLELLEDEQTTWVPGQGDSPNRIDALVHAATELLSVAAPSSIADPRKVTVNAPSMQHA